MTLTFRANIRKLGTEASKALVSTLLDNVTIDAAEESSPQAESASPPVKIRYTAANGEVVSAVPYDPSTVFLLEIATSLTIRDKQSMENLSSELVTYCMEILRQRTHLHPIVVERALTYLLALKRRGHETVSSHFAKANSRMLELTLISLRSFGAC
jgi:golgi-specific brefeldin A-resistance guanine nucleotide exchange factor 1